MAVRNVIRNVNLNEFARINVEQELQEFSSSDEERDSEQSRSSSLRGIAGPAIFASMLVCGLLGTAYVSMQQQPPAVPVATGPNPYLAQVPPGQLIILGEHDRSERLLQDPQLIDTSIKQTLAFHSEFDEDDAVRSLSAEDRAQLEAQLQDAAQKKVQELFAQAAERDPEMARKLQNARIEPEHWEQTHMLLAALHDKRTQELGRSIMDAVHDAHGDTEKARTLVGERLQGRKEELRNLQAELLPQALHTTVEGPNGWEVAVSAQGVEAAAKVQGWDAQIEVDTPVAEEMGAADPTRRLFADFLVSKVVGTLGVVITTILSIITTVMTLISTAAGARLFWIGQGVLDGGVCLATLGSMTPWTHWLPCMIATFFFGIEAIWTWLKH